MSIRVAYIIGAAIVAVLPCGAQTLHGVVTDAATGKPLYPVTVVNKTTQAMVYTDAKGNYTLPANTGDKVVYSYIGYSTEERTKPTSVLIATINVSLEPKAYELKDALIRPGRLSQYQLDSIDRVATYKVQLRRVAPSPIMSPASAIAELFSKKAKQTYAFQHDFAENERQKFIDTKYGPELVTNVTGLKGDSVGMFMYAHPMPYDFARTASPLEIKMWVRDSYKKWKVQDTIGQK